MNDNEIIEALKCGAEMGSKPEKAVLDLIFRQQAEIERSNEIVEKYAASARTISLRLSAFCNTNLPYDEMIADASRKASEEIERLTDRLIKLQCSYDCELAYRKELHKMAKAEAIKEFADS